MEYINLIVIVICIFIMVMWSMRKIFELNTMKISLANDSELHMERDKYELEALRKQRIIMKDSENLEFVAKYLQDITTTVIWKLTKFMFFGIVIWSLLIWYFFEEDTFDVAQGIYFFIGAYS